MSKRVTIRMQTAGLTDLTTVLGKYQSHRLVRGRFFFLLPDSLLSGAIRAVGSAAFDFEQLAMDRELGKLADEDPSFVGLYCGAPRFYPYLADEPFASRSFEASFRDFPTQALKPYLDALRGADEPLDTIHTHARAYGGWLMSNPQFLEEHRQTLATYRAAKGDALEWVMPAALLAPNLSQGASVDRVKSSAKPLIERWKSFYQRWRLSELVAPGLPAPYIPQRGTNVPAFVPTHLHQVVHTVVSTGIFPQVDRDLIERTMPTGGDGDHHLKEWMKIASLSNRRRNDELSALGRRFRLQHYWRVLQQRHPQIFHRNARRLEAVFAGHLGVKPATVRSDLQDLRCRLGRRWSLAGFPTASPLASTP